MQTPIVQPIVTTIKKPKNNPFVTNVEKKILYDDDEDVKPQDKPQYDKPQNKPYQKTQDKPQYNQQDKSRQNQQEIKQEYVSQSNVPMNYAMQRFYTPTTAISTGQNIQLPIPQQKVFNITLPGPTGRHVEMDKIYEIALPGKNSTFSSNTIGERMKMYEYIRSFLIKLYDGEDICLDSTGSRSMLSYFKFMNVNPNYYNLIQKNPYRALPFGLLIYNSCFPIQYDEQIGVIGCAKNSVGINIRLYSLTVAEYYSFKYKHKFYKEYDVWRELIYYEYIREYVIKPKMSPNFVLEYLYLNSPSKTIDFFSLKSNQLTQKQKLTKEYQNFLQMNGLLPNTKGVFTLTQVENMGMMNNATKLPDEINPALQCYSGNTLVILTESPNQNLYKWASHVFDNKGLVEKMISYGIHDEKIWYSIIFQISAALYVLQKMNIYIRDMTIEDNVYIKDLKTSGNTVGYWKYIIDGIPYYVPNYGYLVLIDTNFKDIYPDTTSLPVQKRLYKIYANDLFGKKYDPKEIKLRVYENYKKIVTTNAFTVEYTQNNVVRPPDEIMKFLEKITADPEKEIDVSIYNNMKHYLHNRIGTFLKTDDELPYIRDIYRQIRRGDLMIEVIGTNAYRICMFVDDLGGGNVTICTKSATQNKDYITKQVRIETLKQYAEGEFLRQNYNPLEEKLGENELLETYIS